MYLKEKQYKIAMILLCPVQGPWASSFAFASGLNNENKITGDNFLLNINKGGGGSISISTNNIFIYSSSWHILMCFKSASVCFQSAVL